MAAAWTAPLHPQQYYPLLRNTHPQPALAVICLPHNAPIPYIIIPTRWRRKNIWFRREIQGGAGAGRREKDGVEGDGALTTDGNVTTTFTLQASSTHPNCKPSLPPFPSVPAPTPYFRTIIHDPHHHHHRPTMRILLEIHAPPFPTSTCASEKVWERGDSQEWGC
jgi:hypothetical protein